MTRHTLAAFALCAACHRENATTTTHAAATPPATVAHRVSESELTTVTLTPAAIARLGLAFDRVTRRNVAPTRELGGELTAPPGRAAMLTAPVAGVLRRGAVVSAGARVRRGEVLATLVPFAPADRDLRAQAEQGVSAAQARLTAAEARADRAARMATDQTGSARALEEARADRDVARAALTAARARRNRLGSGALESDVSLAIRAPSDGIVRQLMVAEGQAVSAGAALFEVTAADPLWVRVAVYAGDLARIDGAHDASVLPLAGEGVPRAARVVTGPPTADANAATGDLWYEVANGDGALRPGERVAVRVPMRGESVARVVPWSAVVFDVYGGAWLYTVKDAQTFVRRRIEVARVEGELAVLTRGPDEGTSVVTTGVAELFGTEFGAGH